MPAHTEGLTAQALDALECLLVAGDYDGAAEASSQLLQSKHSTDAHCFHRLLFVAVQSHFFSGRQQQLLEQLDRELQGLLGLPTQVFLVWQLLQLETGGASSITQCCSQVEAFLAGLCTKAKEAREQVHSNGASATAQEASTYADTVALVRFYALELLCSGMKTPTSAAAFVDSEPAGMLMKAEDLECLRAEIASTGQSHLLAGQQHDRPQHPHSMTRIPSGSSSPFCTVLGELDDEFNSSVHRQGTEEPSSLSMPGHGQPTHGQGMPSAGAASAGYLPQEGVQGASACQGQTLWPPAVCSKLRGVRAWAVQTAQDTWAWGRGVAGLAYPGGGGQQPTTGGILRGDDGDTQGTGSSCDPSSVTGSAGRAPAGSPLHHRAQGRETEGSRSSAADLAVAVAVAAVLYAAYRERKAISSAAQARARALRAALLDLARMGLSLNPSSSGFVPNHRQ